MEPEDKSFEATEQMFAAVGRAITQWSFVESQLSQLFAVCVGQAFVDDRGIITFIDTWAPMWVFYAADSFNTKRALVDAAVHARVYMAHASEELDEEWARLSTKARRLSTRRNRLAHWTVIPAQRTGTGAEHEPLVPARLMPTYGSPKYYLETGFDPPGDWLSIIQIGQMDKAFCLYADKVRAFTLKIASIPELLDRDVWQAMRLLVLDGRLDPRVLEELERALASHT